MSSALLPPRSPCAGLHWKWSLKQHYGRGQWEDAPLGQLIVLANQRYHFVQEKRITPLVQKANRILHDYAKMNRFSDEDNRTILIFLKTVKFLIQRAPGR